MKKFFNISLLFFKTLNVKYIKVFSVLSVLTIVSVFFELVSLFFLSLFVSSLKGDDLNDTYKVFKLFNIETIIYDNIILITSLFFLLKFIISYQLIIFQNLSVSRLVKSLSSNFYKNIFDLSYSKFINKSVSEHIKNLTLEIGQYALCFGSYLSIISDGIITLTIFIFLLIINPIESFVSFISLSFVSLIYLFSVKNKIILFGKQRTEVDEKIFNLYTDSLNSIIEIKVYNTFNLFNEKLNSLLQKRKLYTSGQQIISQVPKLLYESVIIIIFITIVTYYDYYDINVFDKVGSLIIFLFGSIKLLPSFNRLINSIQQVIYYKDSIKIISNHKQHKISNTKTQITSFNEIKLSSVEFSYGNKKTINSLNLSIGKNQYIGFIGESGTGKTTILNILTGLLDITKGKVYIDNTDMTNKFYFSSIGLVSQNTNLFKGLLKDNICLNLDFDKTRFINALELSGLDFTDFYENRFIEEGGQNLSGGQKQRIAIARALYHKPQLLLLDEPTSAIYKKNQKLILKALENLKNKITIIIVSHDPIELSSCDKIIKIDGI